jgi:membrane-associated phospholipid phosphatase
MGKTHSLPVYFLLFYFFIGTGAFKHLLVSLIITGILMPSVKYFFRHKRPSSLLENVYLLEPVSLKSFPSADSAYVATLFMVSLFYGNFMLSSILFIIMLLIGYGRVYMGAHFPLDVLVGYSLGFLSGLSGYYIIFHFQAI